MGTVDMTPVHYLFEWVAQEDQVSVFNNLFTAAKEIGCDLRFVSVGVKTSREGYYVETVVLDAPSQADADQFRETSGFKAIISTWQELSDDERSKLETYSYDDPEFIGYGYREFVEAEIAKTYHNKELRTLLENSRPLYFSYDWVVPTQLLANPLEAEFICWIDWNFKFASSVMFDIVTMAWSLGRGREVRFSKDFTTKDGLLGLRLIIRLFGKNELKRYLQSHRAKIFEPNDWKPVQAEDFLSSRHLADRTLRDFYDLCENKSQYNKKLMG